MATFSVVVLAAGKSSRFRDEHYKKPFAALEGRPVWQYSVDKFTSRGSVKQIVVVIAPDDKETFYDRFGANVAVMGIDVAIGGDTRSQSVAAALKLIAPTTTHVAIHDAARPCLTDAWLDAVFTAGEKTGAAILATPVTATLKRVDAGQRITATVPREQLWEAQTPQVFERKLLEKAYAAGDLQTSTDDAQLVESVGHAVTVVPCSPLNIKITTKDDLRLASAILKVLPKPKLFGASHPFADDQLWK